MSSRTTVTPAASEPRSGGTTLRLQVDEIEASGDDDAEDTWLPVLAALRALLDPAPAQTELATEEQAGI